jgi:hypothetical protein
LLVQLKAAVLFEAEEVLQLLHVPVRDSGLPPVQPEGKEEVILLVLVPLDEQVDQSE